MFESRRFFADFDPEVPCYITKSTRGSYKGALLTCLNQLTNYY